MTVPPGEPTTRAAVHAWIREHAPDRFADVHAASHRHREQHGHGCTVYPTSSGPLLGVVAAATRARTVLELGCGLGYSALWLAHGSSPDGSVETIERDPSHAELARANVKRERYGERVRVVEGAGTDVLPRLTGPYDLVFCDGEPAEFEFDLDQFLRLLRPSGLLVSANLFLGQYSSDVEGLEHAAAYRERLLDERTFLTTVLDDGLALSVPRK